MEFYDAEKISKKGLEILSKFNTDSSLAWLMNNVSFKTDKDNELTAHAEKKMMRGKIFERSFELGMYDKIL